MPYEVYPILMFGLAVFILLMGYPVAFSLAGTSILFALFGVFMDVFDLSFLAAFPERIYGIMGNQTLIAIPLFIFMGVMLERAKISEELLETMGLLFGKIRGGLGISVCIVGALLAASTGIVGATVVTMGLISLPTMLRFNYSPSFATGIVTASGTLGQIIPPSIILIILGDVISSAHQQAQLAMGNYSPTSVSVGDLFVGALLPGLVLVGLYIVYIGIIAAFKPQMAPALPKEVRQSVAGRKLILKVIQVLIPPILLITGVLGSILAGLATPTEAASVGCVGGIILTAVKRQLNLKMLREVMITTTHVNCMVFIILLGASMFSLVFRGFEGDEVVHAMLTNLPGGMVSAFFVVMLIMFIMGFFLDFFEITFVVVPIVGPILLMMGFDPIWLGVMIALNLQTSFLTPPFGFALFYLRGVAPESVTTMQIYRGVIPFIILQLVMLVILWYWPELATWLPEVIYGAY
ncbi:MAG: TRAP transporter large permease subunit [Desulfocapsaceae bacterium]|nr:TRAP transporter large permease subunit [Desulfocapsaceae bacterium]